MASAPTLDLTPLFEVISQSPNHGCCISCRTRRFTFPTTMPMICTIGLTARIGSRCSAHSLPNWRMTCTEDYVCYIIWGGVKISLRIAATVCGFEPGSQTTFFFYVDPLTHGGGPGSHLQIFRIAPHYWALQPAIMQFSAVCTLFSDN